MPRGIPGPVKKAKSKPTKDVVSNLPRDENGNIKAGPGRPRGVPNKFSGDLKKAILAAFNGAHPQGLSAWVCEQAEDNPTSAMALLGRLIPVSMEGEIDHTHTVTIKFE
jgi:hypothetical protein